ncbi:hypothetical protein RF11_03526 [Thelohanellus kitauei]|uniref:Uncharacterized protein n=1 Tax=Thelohanellus kitauei TaxID=669202 RepID=A0A0C2IFF7_THEKT|nr:hypothetical protein RF11_03526 [Thelohanellus kitauei]
MNSVRTSNSSIVIPTLCTLSSISNSVPSSQFTSEEIIPMIQKLLNWAAPGPDGIPEYFLNRLPSLVTTTLAQTNLYLTFMDLIPSSITMGNTVLILKSKTVESINDFRPISC